MSLAIPKLFHFTHSTIPPNTTFPPTHKAPSKSHVVHSISRLLQAALPRKVFCWISRLSIQIQCVLWPQKWSYWTPLSDKIIVGAIPLKNWNHHEALLKLGVGAVLSINKKYEFSNLPFSEPVTSKEWKDRKITFLRISNEDLSPVNPQKIAKAVDFIVNQLITGKKVYVHCTGGRGRSISAVIAALIKTQSISLDEAYDQVTQLRPQVILSTEQLKTIQEWYSI